MKSLSIRKLIIFIILNNKYKMNTDTPPNISVTVDSPPTKEENKTNIPYVMDDLNKQGLKILQTKGEEEAIKFMFNPTGDRQLSYAEMRYRFG